MYLKYGKCVIIMNCGVRELGGGMVMKKVNFGIIIAILCIVLAMIIEMLALGIPISLGYGVLGWIQPLGMTLLDFFDFVTNSCMMPISALCTVLLIIFVTKLKTISNEIKISSAFKREKVYNIVMKYICIPTLLIILLSYILSTFGIITL